MPRRTPTATMLMATSLVDLGKIEKDLIAAHEQALPNTAEQISSALAALDITRTVLLRAFQTDKQEFEESARKTIEWMRTVK